MRFKSNTDKGVAGLTILLSLVTMLFVIGLLVMIFSLMGGELQDATYTETTVAVTNESVALSDGTGWNEVTRSTVVNFISWNATAVYNRTINAGTIATNETLTEGVDYKIFTNNGSIGNLTSDFNLTFVSYTYTHDATNTATEVINDTTVGVSGVTDWFDIFIVIGAMVVLILLTVIIITAIRGSGLMAGEGSA